MDSKLWNDKNNEINGNKLSLHREFKIDIFVEDYVTAMMTSAHRCSLAGLRCCSIPLDIELERRNKIPLLSRSCACLCNIIHVLRVY